MLKRKSFLVAVLILGLLIFGGSYILRGRSQEDTAPTQPTRSPLPTVKLQTLDGQRVNLEKFVGTPLVVNSWATWCSFCKKELPDFVTLQEELGDKVKILAVNRMESAQAQREYLKEVGIEGGGMVFLADPEDRFYQAINGFSMPETVFVGANGQIAVHRRGVMELSEMRQLTREVL